jgi:hypothetical protein
MAMPIVENPLVGRDIGWAPCLSHAAIKFEEQCRGSNRLSLYKNTLAASSFEQVCLANACMGASAANDATISCSFFQMLQMLVTGYYRISLSQT